MSKQLKQPKNKDRNLKNEQEVLGHHDSSTCELGQITKKKRSNKGKKDMEMKKKETNFTYSSSCTKFC
jgi:hypothetical protein